MASVIETLIIFCSLLMWFSWLPTSTGQECAAGQWKCSNNTCVTIYARCDGEDDCDDGNDEENCEKWRCPEGRWQCHNHRCILMTLRCDGTHDCSDGSDETNCEHWVCPAYKWKCSNNLCVSVFSRCNGQDDCGDVSDEINCATASVVCPSYIMEGEDATCLCKPGWEPTSTKGSWFAHTSDQHLKLTNVQRADNGSNYTCALDVLGSAKSVYTLRVAYGPYKGHVSVGPSRFIANGSQTFTLTCNVTDVYPTPYYTWHGITCNNQFPSETCSFTPDPAADDLKNVTCTATSITLTRAASKTVKLDFSYPPRAKPVIHPQVTRPNFLRIDDIVTCTVTGGKPLVELINFYCYNPYLPDKDDEINLTSVSSSVTINSVQRDTNTGMTCFCDALWKVKPEYYQLHSTAVFNISHPPTEKPHIQSLTSGRDLLRRGDKLTCTVTGGKPVVNSVHFYCLNPALPDEQDEIMTTTVSSSVTVDLAQDIRELGMTCFCNASWKTRPEWYPLTATSVFQFEYKATVENLTIGDTNEPITVQADDLVTLYVICKSTGRPKPNVTVAKGKYILDSTDQQYQRTGNLSHEAVVTVTDVQCHDMGTYSCTADNGLGDPDTRNIRLNVECKPRSVSAVSWDLTKTHLEFRLEAHPVPTTFVFIHFGNLSTDSGNVVPSEMFSAKCEQDPFTEFIVNCRVTPLNVPKRLLGFYRAHVHNGLGSSELTFTLQEYKSDEPNGSGKATFAAVSCVLFVVIVIAFVLWKKRRRLQSMWRNTKGTHTTRDRASGIYAEIDEYPMNYQRTPQGSIPVGPPPSRPLPLPPAAAEPTHPGKPQLHDSTRDTASSQRSISKASISTEIHDQHHDASLAMDDGDIVGTMPAMSVETGDTIAGDSTDEPDPYNKLRERETSLDPTYSHTRMPTERSPDEDEVYNHLSQGRKSAQDQEPTYSHTDTAV